MARIHTLRSSTVPCSETATTPVNITTTTQVPVLSDRQPVSREKGCWAATSERKYYSLGNVHVKRSLRPSEFHVRHSGDLVVPHQGKERLQNDAACLRFIRSATNIPVPAVICEFEDQEAYYLITEHVEGICMGDLSEEKRRVVEVELEQHRKTLWSLKSKRIGGPTGLVITPHRLYCYADTLDLDLQDASEEDFVFCHNDCSQANIIVDPDTLKINAILDWEYAGFYPRYFDRPWYKRWGPAGALPSEEDDRPRLLAFFRTWTKKSNKQNTAGPAPVDSDPAHVCRFKWARSRPLQKGKAGDDKPDGIKPNFSPGLTRPIKNVHGRS
ncbi:hypothetical protein K461DRAFT_294119 [Myriangium duriaei CBS 260.36]|uniref:Aminoglycoside phosphotransferase domain-containing protein n=1 Tax=Myriangium duriaei CBS 260.36 TaxID=1168546 RepID=A0A9P4MM71_9PEZI|nr:hypothetical protein K461DRAFT_294119 [Myriangium duriaei CBS 260.36]